MAIDWCKSGESFPLFLKKIAVKGKGFGLKIFQFHFDSRLNFQNVETLDACSSWMLFTRRSIFKKSQVVRIGSGNRREHRKSASSSEEMAGWRSIASGRAEYGGSSDLMSISWTLKNSRWMSSTGPSNDGKSADLATPLARRKAESAASSVRISI
jgi:hypothetical protein